MALLTLHRSPSTSTSGLLTAQDEHFQRRGRLQKRESFALVKGAVLLLGEGEESEREATPTSRSLPPTGSSGAQQRHLEAMIARLRPEDTLKLAVCLESVRAGRVRYLLVVSTLSRKHENLLLGMDFPASASDECTIGLVLPVWSDTQVYLDGDGGFSVMSAEETRIFKPVSIQTMWSVLQALHRCCESAVKHSVIPGAGLYWAQFYRDHLDSDRPSIHEWNAMTDLESVRREYCTETDSPSEREGMEKRIKSHLREIMMREDLDNLTSKQVRQELEQRLGAGMKDYKEFIDNETMVTMAQMDKPSKIFDYLYLGSEWNAANFEELQKNGVGYILNVTREIDNFFPESFKYLNIRVYDLESTDLLSHWNTTFNFIHTARQHGGRVLVHCKMGVSRSASTVVAFVMKQRGWSLQRALAHVQQRRPVAQPNPGFLRQLHTYSGILQASQQRHSALWRRKSREQKGLSLHGEESDSESEEESDREAEEKMGRDEREQEGMGKAEGEKDGESIEDTEVFIELEEPSGSPQESWDQEPSAAPPHITVSEGSQGDETEASVLTPTAPSPSRSGRMNLLSLMQSICEQDEEERGSDQEKRSGSPRLSPGERRRNHGADISRRRGLIHQRRHVDVSPEPRGQSEGRIAEEGWEGEEPAFSSSADTEGGEREEKGGSGEGVEGKAEVKEAETEGGEEGLYVEG
ncbi:protein phosphatase Slingshot homolog 3 [Amia ocellicauda]|uniref:protein phosphatase Slingshot homolog 3 n=1 Tax=Amia ocellicauda TaxID=2972642 RepID=UPI0034638CAA